MIKNRFFKNTLGLFAEVIVANQLNTDVGVTSLDTFRTLGVAGDIRAFFDDTNLPVAAGGTTNASNAARSYYYAWKTGDGTLKRTAPIPCATKSLKSVAYSAGTAPVTTATYGGTYATGQILHIRILETTGGILPYPVFEYEVPVPAAGINTAVASLATLINAESSKNSPVVTASAATNVLTLTGTTKTRSFKVVSTLETTVAQPVDASAIVIAETTKLAFPIGDIESVKELERYAAINAGAAEYTWNNTTKEDLGWPAANASAAVQYGFIIVTSDRKDWAVVDNVENRANVVIAVKSADVATIAAL